MQERWYLLDAYKAIEESSKQVVRLQLPCGTGKTFIAVYAVRKALEAAPDGRHVFFCPWIALAEQTCELFRRFGIPTAFVGSGVNECDGSERVVVCVNASVQHLPSN